MTDLRTPKLGGSVAYLVDRPVAVLMATATLLLFGYISLQRLPVQLMPDVSYPTLTVRTIYEDAAPAEVERAVSEPIEEVLSTVEGIREVRSSSRADVSEVIVELQWGTSLDDAAQRIRERLDLLEFEDGVERPLLLRYDPAFDPVVRVGASIALPDDADEAARIRALGRLRFWAIESLKPRLERVLGVAMVRVEGGRESVVQVEIDPERLARLGLTVESLSDRIQSSDVNLPGGRVLDGRIEYRVRTVNGLKDPEDIGNIEVPIDEGLTLPLSELATIRRTWREPDVIARLSGDQGVILSIFKEADANLVSTANAVKERVYALDEDRDEKEGGGFAAQPDEVELAIVADASPFVERAIGEVQQTALWGGLLAVLLLGLVLRSLIATFAVALAMPVSVLATFVPMLLGEVSLNLMSLGGLALGIGMLVDNSVVVIEAIVRQEERGLGPRAASIAGANEVAGAVTASTLTTLAVFGPLVFVEGVAGQVFGDLALTVVFSLSTSLAIAVWVVPVITARRAFFRSIQFGKGVRLSSWTGSYIMGHARHGALHIPRNGSFFGTLARGVRAVVATPWIAAVAVALLAIDVIRVLLGLVFWVLRPALRLFVRLISGGLASTDSSLGRAVTGSHGFVLRAALKRPVFVLLLAVGAAVWTTSAASGLGSELLPDVRQGTLLVDLVAPTGTPLEAIDGRSADLEATLTGQEAIRSWAVTLRSATAERDGNDAAANSDAQGTIVVQLHSAMDEEAVADSVLRAADEIPGLTVRVRRPVLFTLRDPLEVVVQGRDLDRLQETTERVAAEMAADSGVLRASTSLKSGYPEYHIQFDNRALTRWGLRPLDVATRLRSLVRGEVPTTLKLGERRVDVRVRAAPEGLGTKTALEQLPIADIDGTPVRLGQLAKVEPRSGPSEIRRVDGRRSAQIRGVLAPGADLGTVSTRLQPELTAVPMYADQTIELRGQSEEMQRSLSSLQLALALAVFLVFAVMASQFESLSSPLVVLLTVPLGAAGVVAALAWLSLPFSILVYVGAIVLAGIVVNNAIVLVDAVEKLLEGGADRTLAVIEAARIRLRPIAITTLTTILGLLPMAVAVGDGTEIRAPMAVVVIAGLAFSTLLTLIVIPVAFDAKEALAGWFRGSNRPEEA